MSIIYAHINKSNNKKYIGITKYNDPTIRWGQNGEGYIGSKFYDSGISVYGWNHFEHIILSNDLTNIQAEQVEARLIQQLDTIKNGYNESKGAIIVQDEIADIITENFIKKLSKHKLDYKKYLKTEYKFESVSYDINFIYNKWLSKQINTDLDCQRGYIWTEARKQGLWDTLLRKQMIPEIHAITNGSVYDIIDGKQRITTIIKIINNEIPLRANYMTKYTKPLFEYYNKNVIFFKDLEESLQQQILESPIRFCKYTNITEEGIVELFRKLNASAQLSDFNKGIANYIYIRTKYTNFLLNSPFIATICTDKQKDNSVDEMLLIRLLLMILYGIGNYNLNPHELELLYPNLTVPLLDEYKEKINTFLSQLTEGDGKIWRTYTGRINFLPTALTLLYNNQITLVEFRKLPDILNNENPSRKGRSLDKRYIKEDANLILKYLGHKPIF